MRVLRAPGVWGAVLAAGLALGFGWQARPRVLAQQPGWRQWRGPARDGVAAFDASVVRAGGWLLLATTNGELIVARDSATRLEEVRRYVLPNRRSGRIRRSPAASSP